MTEAKNERYANLVAVRKACRFCDGLINPSVCEGGIYDDDHIGPWTQWQGDLDAKVMVVGQDWGGVDYYVEQHGLSAEESKTNARLCELLASQGIRTASCIENQSVLQTPSAAQTAGAAVGQQVGELGAEMSRRNLNIQPTIRIRPGYRFFARVDRDILFAAPYSPLAPESQ